MARIRTIKPEFFTSEDIVGLSAMARLLYIALWCEADREGRLVWKPKTFKMRYFPGDNCDIDALCQEVLAAGLVVLYGSGYAHIPAFLAHQHINPRETKTQLPDPSEKLTRQPRVGTRHSRDSDAQVGREGKGKEGESRVDDAEDLPLAPPPVAQIPLIDGSEFDVEPSKAAEWSAAFPAVDVLQKLQAIRVWCIANPSRRKTRRGAESFIVQWLGKDQDSGRGARPVKAEAFEGVV
ncbi:hypothetical protein [Methylibium sp.]|uniref:hypothetical protein n=1 Tax=Methylibium sp. TaxID=2067992 RepID=UPI0017B6B62A|nr:hypothetical protein [Methylibium sp.]MBA3589697.1 hypothetical protein [Methylibium sp.]